MYNTDDYKRTWQRYIQCFEVFKIWTSNTRRVAQKGQIGLILNEEEEGAWWAEYKSHNPLGQREGGGLILREIVVINKQRQLASERQVVI